MTSGFAGRAHERVAVRLAVGAAMLLGAACGADAVREDGDVAVEVAIPGAEAGAAVAAGRGIIIGPEGMGEARRGLTVGEVRRLLRPDTRLGALDRRFMVDVSAVPVIADGDTLYQLLFVGLDTVDDSLELQLVATSNPQLRTADGLGPGMTLAEAVAIAGPVTLAYNINDESREYAQFEGQPRNLHFRVRPATDSTAFAGAYSTAGEYQTTTRYDPRARIMMVMVDLTMPPE